MPNLDFNTDQSHVTQNSLFL